MRTAVLGLMLSTMIACGPSPVPTKATAPATDTTSPAKPCPSAPEVPPDPAILALASEAVASCEFSDVRFDWECPAYKAWRNGQDHLFEDVAGNPTLLSMLENEDVRMRSLVTERGFVAGRTFFADEKHATRLLAVVDAEREAKLLRKYGKYVAHISGERLLGKVLEGYLKHPSSDFRAAYAENLLPQHPTPFSLKLFERFLADADTSVRRSAMRSLGRTDAGKKGPVCDLLQRQLERQDALAEEALEAATSSRCEGMVTRVVEQIEKRTKKPAALNVDDAPDFSSAASSVCWDSDTPEALKKRVFDVAVAVTPTIKSGWTKRSWLELFRKCDKSRAKAALEPFVTDTDEDVAKAAKDELQKLESGAF